MGKVEEKRQAIAQLIMNTPVNVIDNASGYARANHRVTVNSAYELALKIEEANKG